MAAERAPVPLCRSVVGVARTGLPTVRVHDLRHSAASILLAEGIELPQVTLLLGHSEMRITSDLYAHLMKPTAARAARTMDSVLGGAR